MFGSYRAITLAKSNSNTELSKFLAKKRHLINVQSKKSGRTCLQIACRNGNLDMVLMLILRGADMDLKDYDNNCPLMIALEHGFDDIATTLLERGANVSVTNNDLHTPLHVACRTNCRLAAMFLMSKNGEVNLDEIDANSNTPLHLALIHDSVDIAKSLISHGVEYNYPNINDRSALDIAKAKNMTEFLFFVEHLERSRRSGTVDRMVQLTLDEDELSVSRMRAQYSSGYINADASIDSNTHPMVANTVSPASATSVTNGNRAMMDECGYEQKDASKCSPTNNQQQHIEDCTDCTGDPVTASTVILRNGVPVNVVKTTGGIGTRSNERVEKKPHKRRILERLLAATMFRPARSTGSDIRTGTSVVNRNTANSNIVVNDGNGSCSSIGQPNTKAEDTNGAAMVVPLSEENLHSLPTELISTQLIPPADGFIVPTNNTEIENLVNAQGAAVAPTIDGTYDDTTVVGTINTSVKSVRKRKIKRAKLRKIQHRFNAQPRDAVVDTQILAMIVPTRQRRSMTLLRQATLMGYCSVM